MSDVIPLAHQPVHLGLGAKVIPQPPFTGPAWYADYGARVASDGIEGRLVSMYTFTRPWDHWESHPHGDELVLCLSGRLTLYQEVDGAVRTLVLNEGEAAINPPGIWHTADVDGPTTALFVTAGLGTEHRAR